MSRVRRVHGIAAVLATLTAVALATTAQSDARAASGDAGAGRPARTTLRLHFTGCNSCSVQLQQAMDGKPKVWTSASQRIGSDRRAVFHVRTSHTAGLSFVLRAPWEGDTGAVSNVVTRYIGHKIDAHVTRSAARRARRADGCWAGTTLDEVRLDFHVARVRGKTLGGQPTKVPLAYATHTMSSWMPAVKTFKGTIGNQDAFYCTKPKTTKLTLTTPGCHGCEIGVTTVPCARRTPGRPSRRRSRAAA